jgi:hypothetical protein
MALGDMDEEVKLVVARGVSDAGAFCFSDRPLILDDGSVLGNSMVDIKATG